jgi:hypothetical protein
MVDALLPLRGSLASADRFTGLLRELGWDSLQLPPSIAALGQPLSTLAQAAGDGEIRPEELDSVLNAIRGLLDAIADLENSPPGDFDPRLTAAGFPGGFPSDLVQHLLLDYLNENCLLLSSVLGASGIVRSRFAEGQGGRPDYIRRSIDWGALPALLSDPSGVLRDAFAWGTPDFDSDQLYEYLMDLAGAAGIPVCLERIEERMRTVLEAGASVDGDPVRWALKIPIYGGGGERAGEAGIMVYVLPPSSSLMPGLAFLPYASASFGAGIDISENYNLRLAGSFDLSGGVAVLLRPGRPVEVISGIAAGSNVHGGEARADLVYQSDGAQRVLLLGSSAGSRFEASAVSIAAGVRPDSGDSDLFVEAAIEGGQLVLAASDAGAFIGKLLGNATHTIAFSPAFGISSERRFYLPGSGSLELSVPARLELGPIVIEDLSIELDPGQDRIDAEIGARVVAQLGPFYAEADRIGLAAGLGFPGSGGNLGPLDVSIHFLPPTRIVFDLDSEVVNGGGFVNIDPEIGRYSGGLALEIFGLGISAIVVVDTEVPGDAGWAFFASLGVSFVTPLPIGFGFTLIGVGGLLALNRTIDVDSLAVALKTGAADAVLFPDNILADAAAVLAGLDLWFPVRENTTVIGPVVEIGWGTPTLISAQLGVLIAIPDLIVTLLGSVEMLLPTPDEALLSLRMDVIGAVDVPASTVMVAASLHDSNLLGICELSGDMGFYARFADQPLFLLSVGGYHPQFQPPGALPSWLMELRRVSAAVPLGVGVEVVLTAYVAITSNTVQFGGRFKIVASVEVLLTTYTAEGWFKVNLLLVLTPFKIVAGASAGVTVSAGDRELMGVKLRVHLEGPKPWYATGSATFKFFGLGVDFGFDVGSRPGGEPREIYPVAPDVSAAMRAAGAWVASDSGVAWGTGVVISDELPEGLWVRPDQVVEVRQSVAPLNRTLTAYGEFVPSTSRIEAVNVTLGGTAIASPEWVEDWFAPAQFDRLDASAGLSAPSYERMIAGVRFGDDEIGISGNLDFECASVSREPEESIFRGKQKKVSKSVSPPKRSPAPASRRTLSGPAIRVEPVTYTVIRSSDGERASAVLDGAGLGHSISYADAVGVLERRAQSDPAVRSRLRVAPSHAAVESAR